MNWVKEFFVVDYPNEETNNSNKFPELVSEFV